MSFALDFPPPLAALNALEYPYDDDGGIDFEAYEAFYSAEENRDWIRAWTGNDALEGDAYRFFGQDGTGGMVGFWLIREGADLLDQPVVFFGSEGELGVVARNFADYAWLLAAGIGPFEAIEYGADDGTPLPDFEAFAQAHAPNAQRPAPELLAAAQAEFPSFAKDFLAQCG